MGMKPQQLYYIWWEGIDCRRGEKIKSFDSEGGYESTLLITEALRVKAKDVGQVRAKMERLGFASWVVDSPDTFIPTSYALPGTIFKP
jgi:hypothetical protein